MTLSLFSCAPHEGSPGPQLAPQTKMVSISERASDCEAKLLKQMEDKSLRFTASSDFTNAFLAANESISLLNQINYTVQKSKEEITSIGLEYFIKSATGKTNFRYSISKADKNLSNSLLSLSLTSETQQSTQDVTISQDFQVTQACELRLSQSSEEKVLRIDAEHLAYSKTTLYSDGQKQSTSDQFNLPKDSFLINFSADSGELAKLPLQGFGYLAQIGLVQFRIQDGQVKSEKNFGFDLSLKTKVMSITLKNRALFDMVSGVDSQVGATFTEVVGLRFWQLPKSIWKNLALGSSDDLNSLISYKLPKDYLKTHNSVLLLAKKPPTYDHFGAYWSISNVILDTKSGLTSLNLTENDNPVVRATTSAMDLETNDTIQIQLPQIQDIAKSIRIQESKKRIVQVQLILNYLSQNYVYDSEMANNNIIRPLTTEEALKRGKGVCQHYAVIFTAIARALKIPTRIVSGYLLTNNSPGRHAWNEVEIQPGVWRVIEPQDVHTYTKIQTRFYLPVSRGTIFEDKNKSWAETLVELIEANYTLNPIQ